MYKIIALDLDGTLLNSKKEITDVTKKAIEDCIKKGIKIVIATGRPYQGIQKIIEELKLNGTDNFAMCFNGGEVYNLKNNTLVIKHHISGVDVKRINREAIRQDVNIHAFDQYHNLITPKDSTYTDLEANINNIKINYQNFETFKDNDLFLKAMLIDPEEKIVEVVKNLDKTLFKDYSVVRSAPFFLEFLNLKAQKGLALLELATSLGIKQSETVAFGDAENDLSMIEAAGLGVCMENGMPKVKEIANYITKTNDENGVAFAIYEKILK